MTNARNTGIYGRVNPGVAFSATEDVTSGATGADQAVYWIARK